MKRIFFSLSFLLLTIVTHASHLMGGEITWRTDSLHRYIFEVKLYRDCRGIATYGPVTLKTNAIPGGISCMLVSNNDLNSVGVNCPNCSNSMGYQMIFFEEYIFRSAPVNLPAQVPAAGFYFQYSDCCRNPLDNLAGGFSGNLTLRAFLFADQAGSLTSGLDNSPAFMIPPTFVYCTGEYVELSLAAYDPDSDSISYEWDHALDSIKSSGVPVYYPSGLGYSYDSPLPGSYFNPNNIPASLNSSTGLISFKSYNTGTFLTVVKVTSWRCGVKIAEVFREIPITVVPNSICMIFGTGVQNHSPEIGIYKLGIETYNDTVGIGDTARYIIYALDLDVSNQNFHQSVIMKRYSPHFGSGYTDQMNGCLIPPCATLANPLADSTLISLIDTLNWNVSCAHVSYINGCLQHQRSYDYTFNVKDNFCPINGNRSKTLSLLVTGPTIKESGNILYLANHGNFTIQWYLNGIPIPGAIDTLINVSASGTYSAIATYPGGCDAITNTIFRSVTGIENHDQMKRLYVFADQNKNLQIVINSVSSMNKWFDIISVNGQVVRSFAVQLSKGDQHLSIDINELSSGIYLLREGGNSIRFYLP